MGFLSDIIKAAASEVVNAVMDSVNETARVEEEKEMYMEQVREKYVGIAYDALMDLSNYEKLDVNERDAIKVLMEERTQFAKKICSTSPDEIFSTFDDEDLVKYYDDLLGSKGAVFPDMYVKKVIKLFQDELMSRPVAKRMYAQVKENYFEYTRYDDLQTIIEGNNIFYDEVLKREAENELEHRNYIIDALNMDSIDELDNDEFMQMYALVRDDKSQEEYGCNGDGFTTEIVGTYNRYFGKYRKKILSNCEKEIFSNRKHLVEKFLSEYCEEECEKFSNYSNKKLSSIISLVETETSDGTYDYDLCDKLIAEVILSERGC